MIVIFSPLRINYKLLSIVFFSVFKFATHHQEMDFGTIMCWADNVVGQQKDPCVFHLIAAGKPDSPYNCSLVNQTSDSLEVDCSEGKLNITTCLFSFSIFNYKSDKSWRK